MRVRAWSAALGFTATLASTSSLADVPASPPIRASMVCEAPPGPGRFRCDVELRAGSGRLSWAEVDVVETDDFVLPLRGRLGPREASTHDADIFRWSLGFVAKARGSGKITVRLHAVLCHDAAEAACDPVQADVTSAIVVADGSKASPR